MCKAPNLKKDSKQEEDNFYLLILKVISSPQNKHKINPPEISIDYNYLEELVKRSIITGDQMIYSAGRKTNEKYQKIYQDLIFQIKWFLMKKWQLSNR